MKYRFSIVGLLGVAFLCLIGAFVWVTPSHASATITVNTTSDELNSDGDCSLREAIQAANTDSVVDACPGGSGADTITLPAETYTLTLAGAGENANATGDLDITGPLALTGANMATTIISANSLDRVLHVPTAGVTLTLLNLTVSNGSATSTGGGGMWANGSAVLSNVTFSNNTAGFFAGGGAYFNGPVTMTDTTFTNNAAAAGAGAWFSDAATVTGTTFSNNRALSFSGGGDGGGAFFFGQVTVTGTTFISNSAGNAGGGAYFVGAAVATGDFVNTLFAANRAGSNQGAALYAENSGGDDVVTLRHATVASPTVGSGSAIYVQAGTVNLTNTIVASYTVGLESAGGLLRENYNLFSNVATPYSGTVVSGGNSITGTAAFADNARHKLTIGSAAIDAGTNAGIASDFEGDLRPQGAGFDIGWDEFVPPAADLWVTKTSSSDPALVGSPLTYTLIVTNTGVSTATGVILTDTLPAGLIFRSASAGCAHLSGTVTCALGTLTSAISVSLTLAVTPTVTGMVTNTVNVTTVTTETNLDNNTAVRVTLVSTRKLYLPLTMRGP